VGVLKKLVWVLVAAVAVALAVANRHDVFFVLDPTTVEDTPLAIEAPLYLLIFIALGVGVLIGGCATWLRQGKWRRRAREQTGEAERWQREADRLTSQLEHTDQPRLPEPTTSE
jgi:uncharacterized integral membrane protein